MKRGVIDGRREDVGRGYRPRIAFLVDSQESSGQMLDDLVENFSYFLATKATKRASFYSPLKCVPRR